MTLKRLTRTEDRAFQDHPYLLVIIFWREKCVTRNSKPDQSPASMILMMSDYPERWVILFQILKSISIFMIHLLLAVCFLLNQVKY